MSDIVKINKDGTACFGTVAVLRMTLALFIFHILIILLILPLNDCASVIHDAGWTIKILIIIAMFIGFFWLDITIFRIWAEISRYVSLTFMII